MKSKRGLFVLGLLGFCLMLAVASPAFATTRKTRVTGLNTSITTSTYRDTGRVTYSKSGHWYSVSRAYIKVYRYIGGHWVYHTHIHANTSGSFKVSEPAGYTYKFAYAGSHGHYYSTYAKTLVRKPVPVVVPVETNIQTEQPEGYEVDSADATAAVIGHVWVISTEDGVADAIVRVSRTEEDGSSVEVATLHTDAYGVWTIDLPCGNYLAAYDGDSRHLAPRAFDFSVVFYE